MRFVFKKLFLFFILLSFFGIVFCDITLKNCSKHRLAVSFFEAVGSSLGYCEENVNSGEACLLPGMIPFTISYRGRKFEFGENTFELSDGDYKIFFNISRRYSINQKTGEQQISRVSMICRIFFEDIFGENILCGSESYHSIRFRRPYD